MTVRLNDEETLRRIATLMVDALTAADNGRWHSAAAFLSMASHYASNRADNLQRDLPTEGIKP